MSDRSFSIESASAAPLPLMGPDDPPVVTVHHPEGRARVLLLCDHAGRAVPAALGRLGLEDWAFERHIAYDIGAAAVTRRLAGLLDARAVMSHYTRLLIDLNRALDDPTLIPEVSDGVIIPANRALPPDQLRRRVETFFEPYHRVVAAEIAQFRDQGVVPVIVSIHSFTPVMHDFVRPWHAGILWDRDPRVPVPMMEHLARDPDLCIGDNQPYSGRNTNGGTIETHATPAGLPNVLVEIRQDLIVSREGIEAWANRLAQALEDILADDGLYRVEFFR